jgi:hypothetical protein
VVYTGIHNSDYLKEGAASCPDGEVALGGGASVSADASTDAYGRVALWRSVPSNYGPDQAPVSWIAGASEVGDVQADWSLIVTVICANVAA